MKTPSTLLRTLHYAIGFTAFLMVPVGLVLLWLARQSTRVAGSEWDGANLPGAYLETASYLVMSLGLLLIAGVLAFAKKRRYGRWLLMAGCVAAICLSAIPVFQLIANMGSGWLMTAVLAAWVIFILPYGGLVYLLQREGNSSGKP